MSRTTKLTSLIALFALALLGVSACDEKKKEPETSVGQKSVADKFTHNLTSTEFVKYAIAIGGGGRLVYQTIDFQANGKWTGDAELLLADDPFECTESGTWQMENAGPGREDGPPEHRDGPDRLSRARGAGQVEDRGADPRQGRPARDHRSLRGSSPGGARDSS